LGGKKSMSTDSGAPASAGQRQELVRQRLQALGFDEVRFAATEAVDGRELREWLGAGMNAAMAWLNRTAEKRTDPGLVLAGARSIIMLGVNYWTGAAGGELSSGDRRPRWARYALHEDYHDTIRPGLEAAGRVLEELCGAQAADYRCYVDTGPVLERGWAARAGLGFLGKNGMLISRRHGNWLFLAGILTRMEFVPDAPVRRKPLAPRAAEPAGLLCGKCTRCGDACPTQAIPRPGVVDARRCISYHTIENKGIIPRELRAGIGDRVYGCDVCLDVCPWNRFARDARSVLLVARGEIAGVGLHELLGLTPARFAAMFRATAIKRVKLAGLLRNACVVAGNVAAGEGAGCGYLPALLNLAAHESPVVRAHAVWAVRRITGGLTLLAGIRAAEADAAVLAEYDGPIQEQFHQNCSRA
jgi:epoxyqueuosine reductase